MKRNYALKVFYNGKYKQTYTYSTEEKREKGITSIKGLIGGEKFTFEKYEKEGAGMKRKEILEKLTFISWINKGETCVYTRRIPSFVYPFAPGRKEGFADTLRIYVKNERVWEELNGYLHREVVGFEAEEWRKWAKKQKEESGK